MITIVDYGVGNLAALVNIFDDLGVECLVSGDPAQVATAEKLLLPGVGAFDRAMLTLRSKDLEAPLRHAALERRIPVLGICLGMQLLAERSEEGREPGLGWLQAEVMRIPVPVESDLKVPHIGWAEVRPVKKSPLFEGTTTGPERFYFVHSYHIQCRQPSDVAAVIHYGTELCCAVSSANIHGAQFHPEKSHRCGKRLLRSFALFS